MLQSRVGAIPGLNGTPFGTCLYATLYWIHTDLRGVEPTQNVMGDIMQHCGFNRIFLDFMQAGRRVSRPMFGSPNLAAGTVLVFERNGQPGHGCIVKSPTQIGGYNQTGWFSSAGVVHTYSEHNQTHIVWRGITHPHDVNINNVLPPNPRWGALYALDQSQARDILERHLNTMP